MPTDDSIERMPINELRSRTRRSRVGNLTGHGAVPSLCDGRHAECRSIAGTGSDPPVAPGETIRLAGGSGPPAPAATVQRPVDDARTGDVRHRRVAIQSHGKVELPVPTKIVLAICIN